jgi:hypothetical protein
MPDGQATPSDHTDPAGMTRRVALAAAGPLLIVGSVLLVLHSMALGGLVTFTQPDVPALWLPNFCYLGTSLSHGTLPVWNPYVMGGLPFAADPQSGWMYLLPTVLFSALPCGAALRWYLILDPILAGLGVYWFLRTERLSRSAATVGGLVLALAIAGSRLVVDLPFPGTLAWSALLLAAGARCLHAETWPARLGWVALTALAWGQLAATHLSHGLVIGTVVFGCYVAVRTVVDVRSGRRTLRDRLLLLGVLVVALPLVNLAYFYPRFFYLPGTTLGFGYARLQGLAGRLAGHFVGPSLPGPSSPPSWILTFAFTPGAYLGAMALALAFAGWWSRRLRPLVAAFTAALVLFWAASLDAVASSLYSVVRSLPFGDVYLQSPWRFRYGALLALAVLAGLGVEAWREAASWRRRAWMVAPGVVLWGVFPWFAGPAARLDFLVAGAVVGAVVLALVARRPAIAAVIPLVLAVELVANGLQGQAPGADLISRDAPATGMRQPPFNAVGPISVDVAAYLRQSGFTRAIGAGPPSRFLSLNPAPSYLSFTAPADWPYLTAQQSMLHGVEDAQGYNSIEPLRYWTFVRTVTGQAYPYNNSVIANPSPGAIDLLQVEWEVGLAGQARSPGFVPVAREGKWALYRGPPIPRASFVSTWTVTDGPSALRAATDPAFRPEQLVLLERSPGVPRTAERTGGAAYRWTSPQSARVSLVAPTDGIVLVRNTYDAHWRATVDGKPVPVLRADYFLQGIPVTAGRHTIVLTYRDPAIGAGLAGSAIALALLLGTALVLYFRRRRRDGAATEEASSPSEPSMVTASSMSSRAEADRTPAGQAPEARP